MRMLHALILTALVGTVPGPVWAAQHRRLPLDSDQGRCLYVFKGKVRISGRCFYTLEKNGDFHIDGPRQIFDGIDYPKAWTMADERSADWWADVFRDQGGWDGYGNEDIRDVHGGRTFGPLRRKGHCFLGKSVKICLWRR